MSEEHVFDKVSVELSIVELLSFVDIRVEELIVEFSVVELLSRLPKNGWVRKSRAT